MLHGRRPVVATRPLRRRGGTLAPGHGRRCRPGRTGRLNRSRAGARPGRARPPCPPVANRSAKGAIRPTSDRSTPPFGRRERHSRPGATLVNSRGAAPQPPPVDEEDVAARRRLIAGAQRRSQGRLWSGSSHSPAWAVYARTARWGSSSAVRAGVLYTPCRWFESTLPYQCPAGIVNYENHPGAGGISPAGVKSQLVV